MLSCDRHERIGGQNNLSSQLEGWHGGCLECGKSDRATVTRRTKFCAPPYKTMRRKTLRWSPVQFINNAFKAYTCTLYPVSTVYKSFSIGNNRICLYWTEYQLNLFTWTFEINMIVYSIVKINIRNRFIAKSNSSSW